MKQILFAIPFFFAFTSMGQSSKSVETFSNALLRDDIYIGIFSFPEIGDELDTLESGAYPETQKGYSRLVIEKNLLKLKVEKPFRGNFNNVIFIERPIEKFVPTDQLYTRPFTPVAESKWILLLKSVITEKNEPLSEWAEQLLNIGDAAYLTSKTVFEQYKYANNFICLHWPSDIEKPSHFSVETDEFIGDLEILISICNQYNLDQDGVRLIGELNKSLPLLKSDLGKNISVYLMDLIN